jgi:Response regulator of the LytR/AlgR family
MTWKFAICEDEQIHLDQLRDAIHEWAQQNGHSIAITAFDNALQLLGAWHDTNSFDAFFLDVELPGGMDGMELAKGIRKDDSSVPIVFVTSHKELMPRGYPLDAIDYLVKPLNKKRLFPALGRLATRLKQLEVAYFTFASGSEHMRFPLRSIYFFASSSHYISINNNPEFRFREKMDTLEQRLPSNFARVHQSTIVNLEHVHLAVREYVVLNDEQKTQLPISKRYYDSFMDAYRKYYRFFD